LRKQQMKILARDACGGDGRQNNHRFSGEIDGAEFAGGKGENIAIVLGEGRMLPHSSRD